MQAMLALLRTFSWQDLRHHPWRSAAAVVAVMLGVALAFGVHVINASALDEFSQAVRAVNGQPDLELRAMRGHLPESLYGPLATHPQLAQIAWDGGTKYGHTFPGVTATPGIGDKVICGKTGACRQDYSASEDDNVLVMGVEGDKYALAFFGHAYYEENHEKLKLLGVDPGDGKCVKPSEETVRDGTYKPLSRPLFIYVRLDALQRADVRDYVKYYLDNVSRIVKATGYIALPDEVLEKSKKALEEALGNFPSDQQNKSKT